MDGDYRRFWLQPSLHLSIHSIHPSKPHRGTRQNLRLIDRDMDGMVTGLDLGQGPGRGRPGVRAHMVVLVVARDRALGSWLLAFFLSLSFLFSLSFLLTTNWQLHARRQEKKEKGGERRAGWFSSYPCYTQTGTQILAGIKRKSKARGLLFFFFCFDIPVRFFGGSLSFFSRLHSRSIPLARPPVRHLYFPRWLLAGGGQDT
ncbi:hypothetical protein B0T17DRAFT_32413 [Bombardia bombarda]|uniref:Uncharacterized protein n=1 Tax=Bombardia bombarda TaxID=252184 RepID=A0AA40CDU7_9PEZI|nr:hypothetical protein B0T17DRAFT_32413 [Bombardia bombarda]